MDSHDSEESCVSQPELSTDEEDDTVEGSFMLQPVDVTRIWVADPYHEGLRVSHPSAAHEDERKDSGSDQGANSDDVASVPSLSDRSGVEDFSDQPAPLPPHQRCAAPTFSLLGTSDIDKGIEAQLEKTA